MEILQPEDGGDLSVSSSTSSMAQLSKTEDIRETISDFLRTTLIFEMVPESAKVPILDDELSLESAFSIMSLNGSTFGVYLMQVEASAVTVWNKQREEFSGILSITDVATFLLQAHTCTDQDVRQALEESTIRGWFCKFLFKSTLMEKRVH